MTTEAPPLFNLPVPVMLIGTGIFMGAAIALITLWVFFRARPWLKRNGLIAVVYPLIMAPPTFAVFVSRWAANSIVPFHSECWVRGQQQTAALLYKYCADEHLAQMEVFCSWLPLWALAVIACVPQAKRESRADDKGKRRRSLDD